MSRPARALLHAQALRHNLSQVRRLAPRSRVMAIVKANAYGHGLAWAVTTLHEADAFGVASIEEGLALRAACITRPVCLLEGFFHAEEIPLLVQHRLSPGIHHDGQLQALEHAQVSRPLSVWLKIDTGMHRIGFSPRAAAGALTRLRACKAVGEIRLMSHLANADDTADETTRAQAAEFAAFADGLGLETSLANSAGISAWPQTHRDWVRPGIMLYGASPLLGRSAAALDLRPVMTLETALIAIHRRRRGEPIGYGGTWRCPEDMPVGVAAIGYGDGLPRQLPPGTPVLVNGERLPLVGRVSMDMITIDLRQQPHARIGDPVVLWGEDPPVDEIADAAGTISYELLCRVTERVPRITVNREP